MRRYQPPRLEDLDPTPYWDGVEVDEPVLPAPRRETGTELVPTWRYDLARHQRIVVRRRAASLPFKAGAVPLVTGPAGWGAGMLADLLAGPGAHLFAAPVTGLATATALAVLRYRHRQILAGDTAWFRRATVGGMLWSATTAVTGPAALGLLAWGGWHGLVTRQWRRRHTTLASGVNPAEEEDTEAPEGGRREPGHWELEYDEGDRIAATLARSIFSPDDGQYPGVTLQGKTPLQRGWRWTAQLPEGMTFSRTRGCEEAIAGALDTTTGMVMWEPVSTTVRQAVLTVVTVDLLADGVDYSGPEYYDGRIPIGLLADGETRADLIVASKAGVHCAAFTGGQREGKSNAFVIGLLGMLQSGVWLTLFADGDTGTGSNPVFAAEADWPTGDFEQVLLQLLALEAIVEARQAIRPTLTQDPDTGLLVERQPGQLAVSKILPSEQWPGYGWWLDEFHKFAKDEHGFFASRGINFPSRLEALIRVGAKYGVAVEVATHSLLRPDWGTTTLLAALTSVNHFAFRFGGGANGRGQSVTIDGETYPLQDLPHEGYFLAPGSGGRGAVMGRAAFPADPQGRVFRRPEMNAVDRLAVAPYWPKERRDAVAAYNEDRQRAAAWRQRAEILAAGGDPDATEDEEEDYSGYAHSDGTTVPLRSVPTLAAPTASEAGMNPTRLAILTAVREKGHASNKQLHAAVPGVSPSSMTKHCQALAAAGLIRDAGHGGWAVPAQRAGTGS